MLGRGHRICIIFYSINIQLSDTIVDFHLFYDGAVDIQM